MPHNEDVSRHETPKLNSPFNFYSIQNIKRLALQNYQVGVLRVAFFTPAKKGPQPVKCQKALKTLRAKVLSLSL